MEGMTEGAGDGGRRMQLTGLHHLTAVVRDLDRTAAFYRDVLGLQLVRQAHSDDDPNARHWWFSLGAGGAGRLISFLEYPSLPAGTVGTGSVQHFAFCVGSVEEQDAWREYLRGRGVQTTDVFDRGGLRSIYVRDPDGHVVEIAVDSPGVTA